MNDSYVLNESFSAGDDKKEFDIINRRLFQLNDSNNQNYSSGEVTFDLASIANSGSYIDWKSSYVQIPTVLSVKDNVNLTGASEVNLLNACMKAYYTILHSCRVTLSNMEVVSLQPNISMRIAYELAISSSSDMAKLAEKLNYGLDDATRFMYNAVPSSFGLGTCTTSISTAVTPLILSSQVANTGRLSRMAATNYLLAGAKCLGLLSDAAAKSLLLSYCSSNAVTARHFIYNIQIPMAVIHDYFAKCPLASNSLYSITFQVNAPASCVLTYPAAAAKVISAVTTTSPFGLFPAQCSPLLAAEGYVNTDAAAVSTTLSVGLCKSSIDAAVTSLSNTCSMFVSLVKLSPEAESQYVSPAEKVKTFTYLDVQQYKFTVAGGAQVQQQVVSSLSRLRKMVIIPTFSQYTGANAVVIPTEYKSPFSGVGSPFLSSPFSLPSQYNVAISGQNVYPANLNRVDEFYGEFVQHSLNGSVQGSIVDFSISQNQYLHGYGAIVTDLARETTAAHDDIAKNVVVSFTNQSALSMDYIAYVYYERQISVDAALGNIVI
jgi:hypothetical protein